MRQLSAYLRPNEYHDTVYNTNCLGHSHVGYIGMRGNKAGAIKHYSISTSRSDMVSPLQANTGTVYRMICLVCARGGCRKRAATVWRLSCALRSSSSMRHMPFTKLSRSSVPTPEGSQSLHIALSFVRSSLDISQMRRTVRPSSRSSAPTSSSITSDDGISCGFVMRSTERPRQPAACRLRPGGGDFARSCAAAARRCASIFTTKTFSYRWRAAAGMGVGRTSCGDRAIGFGG